MVWEGKCSISGAQMDLEAHPGHVSMLFEPYKSIGVEIKSSGESQRRFLNLLLFFSLNEIAIIFFNGPSE